MKHIFGIIWATSFVAACGLGVVKLALFIIERIA